VIAPDPAPVDPPAAGHDQRIEASSQEAELGGSFSRPLIFFTSRSLAATSRPSTSTS